MSRVRSPNYPSISLPAAIEAVRKIYAKNHTHKADPATVAKALGYGGINGASASALSALKKFGLIDEVGKELKVSQSALGIVVDPKDSVDRAKAIVLASTLPQLFADLQAEYGESVPSDEILRAFMLKRGFAQSTVDAPIRSYRETMAYVEEAKKLYDESGTEAISNPVAVPGAENGQEPIAPRATPHATKPNPDSKDLRIRQDVFSTDDGDVTITVEWPQKLSADSLADVSEWLPIVQRKIARSLAKQDGAALEEVQSEPA